jgi:hypothetical protein
LLPAQKATDGAFMMRRVDGSSPVRGLCKAPHVGALAFRPTCSLWHVQRVWSTLWSSQTCNATLQAAIACTIGFTLLGLDAAHGAWLVGVLAVGNALLGMALGCSRAHSRAPSSKRCNSCPRSSSHSCCSAACSRHAARWPSRCSGSATPSRSPLPRTRSAEQLGRAHSAGPSSSTSRW